MAMVVGVFARSDPDDPCAVFVDGLPEDVLLPLTDAAAVAKRSPHRLQNKLEP